LVGAGARFVGAFPARDGDAHAALLEAFGFAEQAQLGLRHSERFGDAVEGDALCVHAAIDHRAGGGGAE
jgi:hypothetical protein